MHVHSSGRKSPTTKGEKVWVEVSTEKRKQEEMIKQEVVFIGNLHVK